MRTVCLLLGLFISNISTAQDISGRLQAEMKKLEADAQFRHAMISMYVVESKTGKAVYDKNSSIGLAPASCLKILTSVTAFDQLGKDFHYTTYIGKDPTANKQFDAGSLFVIGRGDPTLGSWRWESTRDTVVLAKITTVLKKHGITKFERNLFIEDMHYGLQIMPEGWIWQDMGNYYGAACFGFNWHENQYDLVLQPGLREGESTAILSVNPMIPDFKITNNITTGPKRSGDNGYIYTSPFSGFAITKGTVQAQKESFTISGSMPNPSKPFKHALVNYLHQSGIKIQPESYAWSENLLLNKPVFKATHYIDSLRSPSLDSINYWFLKRSVNLFGEAFLKSIAIKYHPYGLGDKIYDTAINIVKKIWSSRGIKAAELNIFDGSGLSPANRITTHALVSILQYARQQQWFPSFYYALPEMNGIKMKDGYIGGVRSYTGYVKSRSGTEYSFSFIVNNFDGSAGTVREKIWKLLDLLK